MLNVYLPAVVFGESRKPRSEKNKQILTINNHVRYFCTLSVERVNPDE